MELLILLLDFETTEFIPIYRANGWWAIGGRRTPVVGVAMSDLFNTGDFLLLLSTTPTKLMTPKVIGDVEVAIH